MSAVNLATRNSLGTVTGMTEQFNALFADKRRDNSVSIATGLRARRPGFNSHYFRLYLYYFIIIYYYVIIVSL
jgi:hypothetical protein